MNRERENSIMSTNPTTLLSGANAVALMALAAYSVRNLNEIHSYLDEIRDELKVIKTSQSENTKRSFKAISTLNEKIENASTKTSVFSENAPRKRQQQTSYQPTSKIEEYSDEDDGVSSAIHELMR